MSDGISSVCISNEIEALLEDVAKQENFRVYQIEKTAGSMKGDGHIGIITGIKITGKDDINENKVLNLIIKSASTNEAFREQMPVAKAFIKEIYVYDTVFPMLKAFEIEKGLTPTIFTPTFYKASVIDKSEALVLENLKETGFVLHEGKVQMDDNHISLVMAQYGRLHALSFALHDQHSEEFEHVVANMNNVLAKFFKETFLANTVNRCVQVLESFDPIADKHIITVFGAFIGTIETFLDELCEADEICSVFLHGDCWANNMMFKYEDTCGIHKPTEVRFLDFQVSCKASPVLDLAYFFYNSCSKELLSQLDHYLQIYYDSLSEHLQKLGTDPCKVFPYSVLKDQWKRYAKYGLITATLTIHALLSETDEKVDLKDVAEVGNVSNAFSSIIASTDEYNDRLRHIVSHLVYNGYI